MKGFKCDLCGKFSQTWGWIGLRNKRYELNVKFKGKDIIISLDKGTEMAAYTTRTFQARKKTYQMRGDKIDVCPDCARELTKQIRKAFIRQLEVIEA